MISVLSSKFGIVSLAIPIFYCIFVNIRKINNL